MVIQLHNNEQKNAIMSHEDHVLFYRCCLFPRRPGKILTSFIKKCKLAWFIFVYHHICRRIQ